jgi:hypothetical protein
MTKKSRRIRYSSSNCIQDIIGFFCNYVLSYSKPDQEYIIEVCMNHLQIDEPQETKTQVMDHVHIRTPVHIPYILVESPMRLKPLALSPFLVKNSDNCSPLASPPIPVKFLDRYKPLALPPMLHDLPINYINNPPLVFQLQSLATSINSHKFS